MSWTRAETRIHLSGGRCLLRRQPPVYLMESQVPAAPQHQPEQRQTDIEVPGTHRKHRFHGTVKNKERMFFMFCQRAAETKAEEQNKTTTGNMTRTSPSFAFMALIQFKNISHMTVTYPVMWQEVILGTDGVRKCFQSQKLAKLQMDWYSSSWPLKITQGSGNSVS